MKKIAIMTTGGDCSGLNTVIRRVVAGAIRRGWRVVGIMDGTDGLCAMPPVVMNLNNDTIPVENARLAGSILHNGHAGHLNFETAAKRGTLAQFNKCLRNGLRELKLDGLILVGGNGSMSLAWKNRDVYSDLSLVCIPKTIDMDVPLTEYTVGFGTAVQQLTSYCDQLIMTARSHHRWFVVQSMGRDCGQLALHAAVACGARACLIPEIKFNTDELIAHIKNAPTDYGIIIVSEGISLRGHSGRPADMIARKLSAAGIAVRTAFPEHIQRAGDTTASDRIKAAQMAECALRAIENRETYVMTVMDCGRCHTVGLAEFVAAGDATADPNIPGMETANAYVEPSNPLLQVASEMDIYIGETK